MGHLYGEVQYILDNGHMGPPANRMTDRQDKKTLPSHNFGGRRQRDEILTCRYFSWRPQYVIGADAPRVRQFCIENITNVKYLCV